MNLSLYARLAADNIRKQRRLYAPYLLSGCAMAAITTVLAYLTGDPAIRSMPGGDSLVMMLNFGIWVMILFSAIFLLYTSSFLMKQRNRELGLYNMLGMSKCHVAHVVLWETLLCAAVSIALGLLLGALLAKLFQLGLLRLCGQAAEGSFSLSPRMLADMALLFLAIYALIALRSIVHVLRSSPLRLMESSRAGDKPPRLLPLYALLGAAMLVAGYVMAVSTRNAMEALSLFFIAVLLVIGGTALCFESGSVFLLSLMQKNKGYYYRPNHFISVSGMRYRMMRSGASLSMICILSTMVLVTLSSVLCLYVGAEDMLRTRFPRELTVSLDSDEALPAGALSAPCEALLEAEGVTPLRVSAQRTLTFAGRLHGDTVLPGDDTNDRLCVVTLLPLEDYNALMGTQLTLSPGEALAGDTLTRYLSGHVTLFGEITYALAQTGIALPPTFVDPDIVDSLLLVVPGMADLEAVQAERLTLGDGSLPTHITAEYAFDTGLDEAAQSALAGKLAGALGAQGLDTGIACRADNRADYLSSCASFLFLGAMLSAAFLCAAVLSMYYKQITEGFEDQANYDIMRKVGLSREMIRKSVNSQLLTVFFLPLLASGVHTAFAFPMIGKLLIAFGLTNTRLLALTTLVSFALFAALYTVVYVITSRTYYRIVAGAENG